MRRIPALRRRGDDPHLNGRIPALRRMHEIADAHQRRGNDEARRADDGAISRRAWHRRSRLFGIHDALPVLGQGSVWHMASINRAVARLTPFLSWVFRHAHGRVGTNYLFDTARIDWMMGDCTRAFMIDEMGIFRTTIEIAPLASPDDRIALPDVT